MVVLAKDEGVEVMTEEKGFVLTGTGNFTMTEGTLTTSVTESKKAFDSEAWWDGFSAGFDARFIYLLAIAAASWGIGVCVGLAL